LDGVPWTRTFGDMVSDVVFSPDGSRLAALAKEGPVWKVVVDGKAWSHRFDMAWPPVFSPNGETVAAKVEKKGQYAFVVNDRMGSQVCEAAWDPVFSPDGDRMLLRSIEDGIYYRRVVPVSDFMT
jgi:uncharacterized protein YrrD